MIGTPAQQASQALVDRLLLEQGRLDPLEFLLAAERLCYEDYEAWRTGARPDIQGALRGSPAEIADLLQRAAAYARRQKLEPTPIEHRVWGGVEAQLSVGTSPELVKACSQAWAPPAGRKQLDLFQDASEQLLEESIRLALAERRLDAARAQVDRLAREHPAHPQLQGFQRLIQCLCDSQAERPDVSPAERLDELEAIEPLARRLLGHRARDVLTALWAALAEHLSDQDFDARAPRLHASHAWARAGRWEAARGAIERFPDWSDVPVLLERHAEAAWHRRDLASAREDWMRLCWEHPQEAARALGAPDFPDPWLARLWRDFSDLSEPLATQDFPAWLLLQEAIGASPVPPDRAPAGERGEAYRLLHQMTCGDDDIERRRRLGAIRPTLLRQYLRGR